MKKKSLATLLSGFLTVCLTGVGFASWIIVQGDKEEITGQVNVETVTSKDITLTPTWKDNNKSGTANQETTIDEGVITLFGDDCFSFGPNAAAATTYSWLKASSDTRGEILTLELDVTVSNAQLVNKTNGVNFEFEVVDNATGGYAKAKTAKYINDVTAVVKETTAQKFVPTSTGEASAEETFTIVISTTWGDYFKKDDSNLNPFAYYNSFESAAEKRTATEAEKTSGNPDTNKDGKISYAEDASATLGSLYSYLSGVSFKLTIKAEG